MIRCEKQHVYGNVKALELGDVLLPEELREVKELEIPRRTQSCQVQLVFDGDAALVDASLDILRAVQDR